jgi:putative FmdB family regulatory protein
MPLYEYACDACGHRLEIIQKFSDGPPDACPKCGKGPLQRQQSSPAIQFKGTGWYVTDYAGKGKSSGEKSESESKPAAAKSEAGGDTSSGGEAKTSDTKKADTKKSDTKKSDPPAAAPAPAASKD